MENLYSGSFWCNCRILDRISSGSSDFGESFKDRHAGCASGHFVLCTEKQALKGKDENATEVINGMLIFKSILIAAVVGIYDGIYGPGTGTFLMLLFTGFCHMTLNDAAGATKAINLTTNITALVVFLINGKVLLPLGIAAGVCNMAGNYLGSHSFTSNGHKIVKPVMIVVIVIFFIKVLTELI